MTFHSQCRPILEPNLGYVKSRKHLLREKKLTQKAMPCDALEAKFQNNNLTACSVMRHYGSNPTKKYAHIWISPK